MKVTRIVLLLTLIYCSPCIAQDKIVLRDSTIITAQVIESNDNFIIYTFPNEIVKNKKNKNQIDYILYSSGRKEECVHLSIPTIKHEEEWNKVIVTTNREDVFGLTLVKSFSVKAGRGGIFDSATKAREKSIKKLKQKAAKLGCGIILITSENFGGPNNNISSITCEAYK